MVAETAGRFAYSSVAHQLINEDVRDAHAGWCQVRHQPRRQAHRPAAAAPAAVHSQQFGGDCAVVAARC
jgi:hypothetical protein